MELLPMIIGLLFTNLLDVDIVCCEGMCAWSVDREQAQL